MPEKFKRSDRDLSLFELGLKFSDRETCEDFLRELRWGDSVECPRCDSKRVFRIKTRRIWECIECKYQFSVTSRTIFHKTRLPLCKWIQAAILFCNSKKGLSSKQLERDLNVSTKTAWYILRRLRVGMKDQIIGKLTGLIQCDESAFGGRPKRPNVGSRNIRLFTGEKRRQSKNKCVVLGMRQEGGPVKTKVVEKVTQKAVREFILENTDPSRCVFTTDQAKVYDKPLRGYLHKMINHMECYVAPDGTTTNAIENFWSVCKRSVRGIYQHVAPKYMQEYMDELSFRFNHARNTNGVGLYKLLLEHGLNTCHWPNLK